MFDVGFSELVLCFFVALVVLGPQKLPAVVRTLGRWTGQARAYMRNLSSELERETAGSRSHDSQEGNGTLSSLKRELQEARKLIEDETQSAKDALRKLTSSPPPGEHASPPPPRAGEGEGGGISKT